MNEYQGDKWIECRNAIIESDGGVCNRCGKGKNDGAVLQVHHNKYIEGLKPWEYSPQDCETVCKGCHAEIHGKIIPRTGWEYISEEDLGDLSGECDCGVVSGHRRPSPRHFRRSSHFRIQPAGLSIAGGFAQIRHIEEKFNFWHRFSKTRFSNIHILR